MWCAGHAFYEDSLWGSICCRNESWT
jgi:hypothetical protein